MAEGWSRHLKGNFLEPYSAGVENHGLDPLAVQVMAEIGIDISKQRSKLINELEKKEFDYVITICNDANEKCPIFPGRTKRIHYGFDNPAQIAKSTRTKEEALIIYRRVRDEIKDFINAMPNNL